MKKSHNKYFYITVLTILIMALVYLLFPFQGITHFSEEFLQKFDISAFSNSEARERALTIDMYRIDPIVESDGSVSSWSLFIPNSEDVLMELVVYEEESLFDYAQLPDNYIHWQRVRPGEELRDSLFFDKAEEAKYYCDAAIFDYEGWLTIYMWGDSIDECVNKLENQLLKISSDLLGDQ